MSKERIEFHEEPIEPIETKTVQKSNKGRKNFMQSINEQRKVLQEKLTEMANSTIFAEKNRIEAELEELRIQEESEAKELELLQKSYKGLDAQNKEDYRTLYRLDNIAKEIGVDFELTNSDIKYILMAILSVNADVSSKVNFTLAAKKRLEDETRQKNHILEGERIKSLSNKGE